MSDIICITSFLDIPRFSMSLVTIISSTYFTFICYSNECFLLGKAFSNFIGILPILCKQLVTVILGMGSSHTPLTARFLRISRSLFSFGLFSSFRHKVLIHFAAGSSNSFITMAVSCSDELSDPNSIGTNSQ